MRVVGLTGGIASGKSLVADIFGELGIPVIDTDIIARQVVAPGHPAWQRLRDAFPAHCFLPTGELDRAAMAQLVFTDPDARRRLEAITHPAIFAEVDRQLAALRQQTPPPAYAIVVVPLLFEVGAADRFDAIIVVKASREQQRARLIEQRAATPDDADARLAAQWPIEEKLRRADYIIDNSGSVADTRRQVAQLHDSLRSA